MNKKDFPRIPRIISNLLDEYAKYDFLYWYPLNALKKEIPVIAYNLDAIYRNNDILQIESCLKNGSISKCDSFQAQFGNDVLRCVNLMEHLYEKDQDGYVFPWIREETYYFDGDRSDWIIYISHEGTITFTGERIVKIALSTMDKKYFY